MISTMSNVISSNGNNLTSECVSQPHHDTQLHINTQPSKAGEEKAYIQEVQVAEEDQAKLEAAATRIQSVYRGYQVRRELYKTPLTYSQKWRQLIDHSRIAQIHKMHEEGTSPIDDQANSSTSPTDGKARLAWRRAEFLVSRLGKGSSGVNPEDTLVLLTEHWLEMSDKKHRYGSNLKPYHQYWLNHNTSQSFFYWLDKGDGKDVNLDERSRDRLDKERVKYLQEHERAQYVVHVIDGLLYYKQSGEIVHTLSSNVQAGDDVDISQLLPDNDANDDEATRLEKKRIRNMAKFIYVTDKDGTLYIARKVKGQFHHSSFLGGGTVCAAGGIIVNNGRIVKITPKSGHYRPTQHHFEALVGRLEGMGISLAGVSISKKILESNTASAEKILVAQELPEVATS